MCTALLNLITSHVAAECKLAATPTVSCHPLPLPLLFPPPLLSPQEEVPGMLPGWGTWAGQQREPAWVAEAKRKAQQ